MKRHPGLHPLSEHHHHALVQALLIRRADQAPSSARAAALLRAARNFLRFWKKTGQKHFREEEEVLLPAYSRHVPLNEDAAVMRMLADHASIRAHIQDLEKAVAEKRAVDTELTVLGRLLHDHVRHEENQVFPRIETALGEVELLALGRRLSRLHQQPKR